MGWLDVLSCCVRGRKDDAETEVLVAPRATRGRGESVTSQDGYGTMSMTAGGPAGTRSSSRSLPRTSPGPNGAGITEAQRERMHEISRTAGSHMRPIGYYIAGRSVSPLPMRAVLPGATVTGGLGLTAISSRSTNGHANGSGIPSEPSTAQSSRTPSPSPPRPESSPPDGVISPAHSQHSNSSRTRSRAHSGAGARSPRARHWSTSSMTRPSAYDPSGRRVVSAPVGDEDEVVHKSIFDGLVPTAKSQPGSRRSSGSSRKKKARRASHATR